MIVRNNWKVQNKQWDKFNIRVRLGKVDVFHLEADLSRKFFMVTVMNFMFKNR